MDLEGGGEVDPLPCGRDAAQVWDTGRPDEHTAGCPYCSQVLADARALRESTGELAAEPVPPPPSLARTVISSVRAELRPGRLVPLPADGVTVVVGESVLAAAVRYVADGVGGVRAGSCVIEGDGATDPLRVSLGMSVRWGPSIPPVAAAVREAVATDLARLTGRPVAAVDVAVTDLFGLPDEGAA